MDTNTTSEPSEPSEPSVTALDYIKSQLALEREAREILPYSFSTCTYSLGPLRQPVYSCVTHSIPSGAAICYSCSISCHGDCELVELFNRRNIQCDCGTTRFPNSPCTLRLGVKGDQPAETNRYCHNYQGRFCACDKDYDAAKETGTMYQCILGDACNEDWFHDTCIVGVQPADGEGQTTEAMKPTEKKDIKDISMGKREAPPSKENLVPEPDLTETDPVSGDNPTPAAAPEEGENNAEADDEEDEDDNRPPGFPEPSTFSSFICWLCVAKNPWLRNYSGRPGFLLGVVKQDAIPPSPPATLTEEDTGPTPTSTITKERKASPDVSTFTDGDTGPIATSTSTTTNKRKASPDVPTSDASPPSKRPNTTIDAPISSSSTPCTLPPPPSHPPHHSISLFLTQPPHLLPPNTFCHCPTHSPLLSRPPLTLFTSTTEEETYEPPLSASASPTSSHAPSILDMGERALSTMDRVKAIEGVMAYNHIKDKVKDFLAPFARDGKEVGAEDVRKYFEMLRGDAAVTVGSTSSNGGGDGGGDGKAGGGSKEDGDGRKEQRGKSAIHPPVISTT